MDASQRKEMINAYKNRLSVGAVYALVCSKNQRQIVRYTTDMQGIQNRFQFALSTKTCPDPAFRSEWNQYGAESISIVVLEELEMKEGQTSQEFAEDMKLLYDLWMEKNAPHKV